MIAIGQLDDALRAERHIFRVFNYSEVVSPKVEAFYSLDSQNSPHWNTAYPNPASHAYTSSELRELSALYEKWGRRGHILTQDPAWKNLSVETCWYFMVTGKPVGDSDGLKVVDLSHPTEKELDTFCTISKVAFHANADMAMYFRQKMGIIHHKLSSHFYLVSCEGAPAGICSTFEADSGASMLFNVAVLPEFRGRNLAAGMLGYVARQSDRPLFVYTNSPAMRDKILPQAGFSQIGELHTVELEDALSKNEAF